MAEGNYAPRSLCATYPRASISGLTAGTAPLMILFEFAPGSCVQPRLPAPSQSILRGAETHRASRKDPALSTAWELTMRALPACLAIEPIAEGTALELLERAMELAPRDALPRSQWLHGATGLRAGHHIHCAVR